MEILIIYFPVWKREGTGIQPGAPVTPTLLPVLYGLSSPFEKGDAGSLLN